MNKSIKTFGYGFSALVLSLSSVNLPAIIGSAKVGATTYDCATEATDVEVSTAEELVAALAAENTAPVTLCGDIDATSVTLTVSEDQSLNLNGHTLTGGLNVSDGVDFNVFDDSESGEGTILNNSAIITLKIGGGANVTIFEGNFMNTAEGSNDMFGYAAGSASTKGAETINILGGNFTGVALPAANTTMASIITISNGVDSKPVFATNPEDSNIAIADGFSVFEVEGGYIVTAESTVTPTVAETYTLPVGTATSSALFTTDNAEYGNELTFTVKDEIGNPVSSDIYTITSTVEDGTTSYYFTFNEVGSGTYKINGISTDGVETATATVTVYQFDEEARIQNIYFEESANHQIVDITSYVEAYLNDSIDIADVTVSSTDASVAKIEKTTDGDVTTITLTAKRDMEGFATISVNTNDSENTTFSFDVYLLDDTASTQWLQTGKSINAFDLSTLWGDEPTITGGLTVDRNTEVVDEETEYLNNIKITSTGTSAEIASVKYTAGAGWVYSNGAINTEAEPLEKDITIYTYALESDSVALKYEDGAEEPETLDLVHLFNLPEDTEDLNFAISNVDITAAEDAVELDGTTLTAKAANQSGDVVATITDGDGVNKDVTVTVSTYATTVADVDPLYTHTATVNNTVVPSVKDAGLISGDFDAEDNKLVFFSEDFSEEELAEIISTSTEGVDAGDAKIIFNTIYATETGTVTIEPGTYTITAAQVLGGNPVNYNELTFRVYGVDVENDYYVTTDEGAKTIAIADPWGTVSVKTSLNYIKSGDNYIFETGSEEGDYTIVVTDTVVETDAEGEATGPTHVDTYTINIHVAEATIVANTDAFTADVADEEPTEVVVADSDPEGSFVRVAVLDSEGEDYDGIVVTPEEVTEEEDEGRETTYSFNVSNAEPGKYTAVFGLVAADGETILDYTETAITVTEHASIIDGVYTITSALGSNMVLDIAGGSTADDANVQLYTSNDTLAQQYYIEATEDGFYTIRNIKSGYYLDVEGGVAADGTNVQQHHYNGTASQKWVALEDAEGNITFASAINNEFVLDIAGGSAAKGTNVQIYASNDTDSQKFTLTPVEGFESNISLSSETTYTIDSALGEGFVIDVAGGEKTDGTNVQLYTANETEAQSFHFISNGDGTYTIASALASDMVLDVAGGNVTKGTNVQLYKANGTTSQKWVVIEEDGYVTIRSLNGGLYLDVAGGNAAKRTNVQVYTGNGTKAQLFKLTEVSSSEEL